MGVHRVEYLQISNIQAVYARLSAALLRIEDCAQCEAYPRVEKPLSEHGYLSI